jgi:hypothetical protein
MTSCYALADLFDQAAKQALRQRRVASTLLCNAWQFFFLTVQPEL